MLYQKKKVLHIIQSLANGGCENMLLRTLPLLREKFDHHIITLKEPGELAPRFTEQGIPVITIHQSNLFDIPSYQQLLSKTRELSPDIVITYLFHADMIGRLFIKQKLSIPVIPFLRTTYNHPKYLIARILEWITKPLVNQYLANSEAVKAFYIKHIGVRPEKITVIPNGINISIYGNADGSKIIQELGLPDNRFVITCVANLAINKGHRYLLEAFESVSQKHPESYLLLVGDGSERNNLENQIQGYRSKNNILFLGHRTDVPDILKASDCFILPTLFEGMSNAILEAMAAGLPIITTDIPENKDLIKDKKTGILFPVSDTRSLTEAIESLIVDETLRKEIGKNAKQEAENRFHIQIVTSLLTNFYQKI